MFLTFIDAYTKFLTLKEIENKSNIENKVLKLLQHYPLAKIIMTDNEPSFKSAQFRLFISRIQDTALRMGKLKEHIQHLQKSLDVSKTNIFLQIIPKLL